MLQKIAFIAFSFGMLGAVSCQNLKKKSAEDTTAETTTSSPSMPYWKASHIIEGSNPDSAGTYMIAKAPAHVDVPIDALPPATASHRAYLATGWWHMNMAYQPSDTLVHLNYQNKWLRFREDQTFDILIKNKVVDTGRWNWDEKKNDIYLSCKDPYINNTWNVIDKGFVMIWKGNTDLNVTGIQIRVADSRTPPPSE